MLDKNGSHKYETLHETEPILANEKQPSSLLCGLEVLLIPS